tara:strand:+ start:1317 stop:1904 length:588 start_codon:yes stop_codon:yes gene_type:complete
MNTSTEINELAAAMAIAQGQMGAAYKNSSNPHFKSSFADLASISDVIKQPLSDNGLSVVQFPINNEQGVAITTRVMHKSGQWIEESFGIKPVKAGPQEYGSLISYFRRYALAAIFAIPQTDDDANSIQLAAEAPQKPVDAITGDQVKALVNLLDGDEKLRTQLMDAHGISKLEHLQSNQFRPVYDKINQLKGVKK